MIYRGLVRTVNSNGTVNVEVPRLREGFYFANCLVNVPAVPMWRGVEGPHSITPMNPSDNMAHVVKIVKHTLVVGDRVLCALLEGDPDALVVLGRVSG